MFWKTLGITWTVLLLAGIALFWQSRRPRAGSAETEALEQEGLPRGTQVTAIVADVPSKYVSLAPDLVHMRSVRARALMQPEIVKWPKSFRQKVLLEPRKYYSVRRVGPRESGILAVDVRACERIAQADELARAVAEAFINEVQSAERRKLDDRITHAYSSLKELRLRMERAQTDMAGLCGGSWFPGKGDALAFHEARLVSERRIDAGVRLERARVRLMAAQVAALGLRAAEMPAAAPRPAARGAETRPIPSSKPAEPVARPGSPGAIARRITELRQAVAEAMEEVTSLEERKRELKLICTDVARKRSCTMAYERELAIDQQSCVKLEALVLELRMERQLLDLAPRLVEVVLAE